MLSYSLSNLFLISRLVSLPEKIPSNNVLKYKPVPPHRIGVLFLFKTSWIFSSTNFAYSPAEIVSPSSLTAIKWWGIVFNWSFDGCAVPIGIDLYICLESTPIISPLNLSANWIEASVLPEAVGPNKKTIGFLLLIFIKRLHFFHQF